MLTDFNVKISVRFEFFSQIFYFLKFYLYDKEKSFKRVSNSPSKIHKKQIS